MPKVSPNHIYDFVSQFETGDVAVAFSGGGDSTALLHMLKGHPRVTHAFIIDHNLRAGSADEAAQAADMARELGYQVTVKMWEHGGVTSGLQARAREFRYGAMGQMCRAAGITHLLTGHTRDDQAETVLMRKARDTGWRGLAGMALSSYAPIWPQLAGVYLHRPLLAMTREQLREYNRAQGLSWVEDPSNENTDFTRIKARAELGGDIDLSEKLLDVQKRNRARLGDEAALLGAWLERFAVIHDHGYVTAHKPPPEALLGPLLRAASGTGGPIETAKLAMVQAKLAEPDFTALTLAGAWIVKKEDGFLFTRDMAAVKPRGGQEGLKLIELQTGEPYLWDGRFMVRAATADVTVRPALGQIEAMTKQSTCQDILALPKEVRPTLPVFGRKGAYIGFGAGLWNGLDVTACHSRRLLERFKAR